MGVSLDNCRRTLIQDNFKNIIDIMFTAEEIYMYHENTCIAQLVLQLQEKLHEPTDVQDNLSRNLSMTILSYILLLLL